VRIELARSPDGFHVPYVAEGGGPPDVVHVLGLATHQRLHRLEPSPHGYYERLASFASVIEEPRFLSYCERLARFSRFIVVDERGGTGAAFHSTSSVLTLEERMDDITAVLDALEIDQVVLMGDEDTIPVVLLYAATFPSRVHSLVSLVPRESLNDLGSAPSAVDAPTLVLLQSAEAMAGATSIEIRGECVPLEGDLEVFATEIQELTGRVASPHHGRELATILLTDIVDSTRIASEFGTRRWTQLLDQHDALVRRHLERFGGRAIKSTGDGVLATFDGPARAMRCACALRDAAQSLGIGIRAGLHTGEIEARGSDIAGIAVHIAARVESLAQPGEVWVSSTIPPLVAGSGITFLDRGEHTLKGVPGSWTLLAVEP
jgi:class 3 adenylate cyclase